MIEAQLSTALGAATCPSQLDEISRLMWAALAAGEISEEGAARLSQAVQARRRPAVPRLPLEVVDGGLSRQARQGTFFPPKRRQRSPDRDASMRRKRRLAAAGPMPPTLAANFTSGELAVLAIVADEVVRENRCDRSIDELAARAGVSRSTAKRALRTAEDLILIVVHRRPQVGRKHLPNLIAVVSDEWRVWLERRKRSIGVQNRTPTDRNSRKKAFERGESGSTAANTLQPAAIRTGADVVRLSERRRKE